MQTVKIALILVLACFCLANKSFIKIEGARFRQLKIAVPAAVALDKLAQEIAQKVTAKVINDLELTDVFQVLEPSSYLVDSKKEGIARKDIFFKNWDMIGAEGLVKIELRVAAGTVFARVGIHQLGALGKSQIVSIQAAQTQAPQLAHKIADDIYKFFTNEEGIFLNKIVASKVVGTNKQIVLMDIDGENERLLTHKSLNVLPSIFGKELFFTEYGKNAQLVAMNLITGEKRTISAQPGMNMGASASSKNNKIAFTISTKGSSHIYVLDRNTGKTMPLTTGYGINTSPSWSPDRSKIAFVSSRAGNPHIYVMNADGSNPVRKTFKGNYNQTPKWSPQGDSIAFTARDERNRFDIFLLDINSGDIKRVTQEQGDNEDPSFSPDGKMLVFSSTRTGKREIFMSNLTGSKQRKITSHGEYSTPSFGNGI